MPGRKYSLTEAELQQFLERLMGVHQETDIRMTGWSTRSKWGSTYKISVEFFAVKMQWRHLWDRDAGSPAPWFTTTILTLVFSVQATSQYGHSKQTNQGFVTVVIISTCALKALNVPSSVKGFETNIFHSKRLVWTHSNLCQTSCRISVSAFWPISHRGHQRWKLWGILFYYKSRSMYYIVCT